MQCRDSSAAPTVAILKQTIDSLEVHSVSVCERQCPVIGNRLATPGTLQLLPPLAVKVVPFVEQLGIGQCLGVLP